MGANQDRALAPAAAVLWCLAHANDYRPATMEQCFPDKLLEDNTEADEIPSFSPGPCCSWAGLEQVAGQVAALAGSPDERETVKVQLLSAVHSFGAQLVYDSESASGAGAAGARLRSFVKSAPPLDGIIAVDETTAHGFRDGNIDAVTRETQHVYTKEEVLAH